MKCPSCGANASGKFCSICGARLAAAGCAACGAPLSAGAKFCHACGAPAGARASAGGVPRANLVPWMVAGGAVVALLVVLAVALLRPGTRAPAVAQPGLAGGDGSAGPVNLAELTPREAADRLFERVMSAEERGATDTAAFFAPMALRAYEMVGALDEDARYHVGLISLVLDDLDAAGAQADSIARSAPTHLFAPILRARVARDRGDAAAQRRAEQAFLDHYEAELATNRPEYQLHGALLEQYRKELLEARGNPR
jgi:Double zinc ribbon